jgi:ribosome maturation factor RimP
MGKSRIIDIVPDLLGPFLLENQYELFNIEYVKEGKDWFLRIFIDKADGDDRIGIDDCEKVSRYLSEKLDEADLIERNYYLEVSSPGLDRPLLNDSDYSKYKGQAVDILLYKPYEGHKSYTGVLNGLKAGKIVLIDEEGKLLEIPKDKVAKTKLAVFF